MFYSSLRFGLALLLLNFPLMQAAGAAGATGIGLFLPPGSGAAEQGVAKLASSGSYDQALSAIKKIAAQSQPADLRCRAFVLKSQIDEALDDTDNAAADVEAAWKTGQMDSVTLSWVIRRVHHYCSGPVVIEMCNKLTLSKDPLESSYAYFVKGRMETNAGRFSEATKDYEASMKLNSKGETAFLEGGGMYLRCGKYEQAVSALTHALELITKEKGSRLKIGALRDRAKAYAELKRYPQALTDYSEAIKMAPLVRELYIGRSNVYKAMGQRSKSEADLAQVRSIDNGY